MNHDWIPSTLGHGNTMCRRCKVTDLEAESIGLDECPSGEEVEHVHSTCPYCGKGVITQWVKSGCLSNRDVALVGDWAFHGACWDKQIEEHPP